MRKYLLLIVLFVSVCGFSQSVNDYQYVIIPVKFSIFKENDRYRLNTTTKILLDKYGFKTFFATDNIPTDIGDNCQRLYADLIEDKDMFSTKIKIVLKDCKENIVYETEYGKSREKDYAVAYNQALRETAKSFDKLNYKYNGKQGAATEAIPVNSQIEIVVPQGSENQVISSTTNAETFYFAQPTATGFQVVNNEPRVIMRLFNTSQKGVFIASKDNLAGVLTNNNGRWVFDYYQNGKLISEPLNLKF